MAQSTRRPADATNLRPTWAWAFVLVALAVLATSCERYNPRHGLNAQELEAVDRITRDPWVRLWRTLRDTNGTLEVWTRQGEERIRYRVMPDPQDDEAAWLIRRIGDHPVIMPVYGTNYTTGTGSSSQFTTRRHD